MKVLPVVEREIAQAKKDLRTAEKLLFLGRRNGIAKGMQTLQNLGTRLNSMHFIDSGPALDKLLSLLKNFPYYGISKYENGTFEEAPGTWITLEVFVKAPGKRNKEKEKGK